MTTSPPLLALGARLATAWRCHGAVPWISGHVHRGAPCRHTPPQAPMSCETTGSRRAKVLRPSATTRFQTHVVARKRGWWKCDLTCRALGATAVHRWSVESIVNLEAFPLQDLDSAQAQEVIAECQEQMRADGYCVLRRFLLPAAVAAAGEEVRGREDTCFVQSRRVNMWGENPLQHGDLPALALRRLASPDMFGTLYTMLTACTCIFLDVRRSRE